MSDETKALEDLKANIKRVLDLESDIQKGVDAGEGVAELKTKVQAISQDIATQVDAAKVTVETAIQERQDEFETKMKERIGSGGLPASVKTAGAQIVDGDAFKALGGQFVAGTVLGTVDLHGIQRLAQKGVTLNAGVKEPDYMGDFVVDPDARLAMRDLIPGGTTSKDAKTYRRVTQRATAAAPTASGTALPESTITITRVTDAVQPIGHYIIIDEDDIADVDGLRSLIDAEMTYGLRKVEDTQLLSGDGTGQNLNGLIPNATAYSTALETALSITNKTFIDELRVSVAQLANADYAASGIVLSPQDWAGIETRKTTDGAYIFVNPVNGAGPRLWGLPVVATTQMTIGAHLVGDFRAAAQLFDRQRPQLMLGYINDQFIKNEMAIKVRERLVLCVRRPAALVHKAAA